MQDNSLVSNTFFNKGDIEIKNIMLKIGTKIGQKTLDDAFLDIKDVKFLPTILDLGANINAKDLQNKTKLWHACDKCDYDMVEFLIKQPNIDLETRAGEHNYTPIMAAYDLDIIKLLKEAGANINAVDNEGNSVIMINSVNENVVRYLFSCGVDLSIKNENNETIYDLVEDKNYITSSYDLALNEIKKLNNEEFNKLLEWMKKLKS